MALSLLLLIICYVQLQSVSSVCNTMCPDIESITSFYDLECSILSKNQNMQNLMDAFFPANQYPAVVVEVQYFVITMDNQSSEDSRYIYRWVSTPALLFGDPKVLEGLSLRTLVVHQHYASLFIAPFAENLDNERKKELLSNVTTWLKSYAIKRSSTIEFGMSIAYRGYSSYKDLDINTFVVYGREEEYRRYIIFVAASLFALTSFCLLLVPIKIDKYYLTFQERSLKRKKKHQRFKLKSILWAFICVFGWMLFLMTVVSSYHMFSFGFQWNSIYGKIFYPVILVTSIVISIIALLVAIFIAYRKRKNSVPIPYLFYITFCQFQSQEDEPKPSSFQYVILFIWQVIAIWIVTISSVAITFFTCGVLLAIFANPVEVIATVGIYITVFLCAVFAFAYIFEKSEEIISEQNLLSAKVRFMFQVLVFITVIIFLCMFGYTYLRVILLVGNINDLGLVTGVGKLIPVLSVAVISWLMKRELQKYSIEDPVNPNVSATNRVYSLYEQSIYSSPTIPANNFLDDQPIYRQNPISQALDQEYSDYNA